MAKATYHKEVKTIVEDKITIDMNIEESIILLDILRKVGGSPTKSGRRFSDAIQFQLEELKIPFKSLYDEGEMATGSIGFSDKSLEILEKMKAKFINITI